MRAEHAACLLNKIVNDRASLVDAALSGGALDNPMGVGLGGAGAAARNSGQGLAGIDNGFLQTVWMFGWFGAFLYLGGFLMAVINGLINVRWLNQMEIQFLAVSIALFASNLFESSFEDIKGVMVWSSLAIVNIGTLRKWLPRA